MESETLDKIALFLQSCNCSSSCSVTELTDLYGSDFFFKAKKKLEAPMPWIGLYITAASAVCFLAMAGDAFLGFRSRRLWLPCKYFSLNAFSLTLLSASMKLPLDLTSLTMENEDQLARLSSLVLMSTSMSNFMTSLGSMTNNDIILNLVALAILVITVAINVCIHLVQMSHLYNSLPEFAEEIGCTIFMILLLLILCFSAVMVPTAKEYMDLAYREMHKKVSNKQVEWGEFTIDELRKAVRRYWVMAQTGSSQFVIARSVTCVTSGFICLLMGLTLLQAKIRWYLVYESHPTYTDYKWSIIFILVAQSIGVVLGSIAPLMRWFVAAKFKSSKIGNKSFKDEFKVEIYWTQRLVRWRETPVPPQIGSRILRKLVHDAQIVVLNLCIRVQVVIVLASKLVLFVSAIFFEGLLFCFCRIKNIKACKRVVESTSEMESDYILLLEGEHELPQSTLTNISKEVDKLIKIGGKKQPKNLIELLRKSVNFNGVRAFDSSEVPSLHSHQQPPNCWSLPVVTLTSIAISLPNVADHKLDQLLSAVGEGLYFAKLIEKSVGRNEDLAGIRHAAHVVWGRVELSKKWQDNDLQTSGLRGTNHKETLQNLSNIAEQIITDFTSKMKDPLMQNPLNWPAKIIAAHSMYRVNQTILLAHKDDDSLTDEELFERISIMISDILAACLTNLVCVITLKCHSNAIEEREESVRQAAILLGESEEILEMLQKRGDLPSLDPKKAGDIEGWRAFMESNPSSSSVSASSINDSANRHSNIEQVYQSY